MDSSHMMNGNYMAHGFCFDWEKPLVALHVSSDIITGLSYYSIALAMLYCAYRRKDLPFHRLFVMFALFILSCGTTHFFSSYTIFDPRYWQEGYVKAFTAAISAATAILLIPRIPEALALPSLAASLTEIRHLNAELHAKNAELQMANYSIEKVLDPIYWISKDARIWKVNEAACAELGFSRDELLNLTIPDINPDFPAERWAHHWLELQEKGALRFETRHRTKNGKIYDVEVVANYIVFEGQEFNCATVRDITQRKRAETERLNLELKMLHTQKLESLGVLAGGIAHDFNNILTSIIGNADLALMRITPESAAIENLHRIETSAARAADLARQMLAYSGKGRFVIENIDLNNLIEEMIHMLDVSISKKSHLRYNLTKPLPAVNADATQLRQVIMNLVINASEAIGDRDGTISITTGTMQCDRSYLNDVWLDESLPEGAYAYLEIADTGCGMDRETREKIFDPFFTTKFTGRGLGMAAVMGIVRGHKGAIKVYSEPGKGTTFKILLPVSDDVQVISGQDGTASDWRGCGTALLVDDEETVRTIGTDMLQELGFRVITASDGRQALELYREHREIGFVILDLTMPQLDGEQTFRELRRLDPSVKVIMTSGYNEQEVTQKFVGKGLAGFIQKPYKLSMLRDVVRKMLS